MRLIRIKLSLSKRSPRQACFAIADLDFEIWRLVKEIGFRQEFLQQFRFDVHGLGTVVGIDYLYRNLAWYGGHCDGLLRSAQIVFAPACRCARL
jgi:hypothetical protein